MTTKHKSTSKILAELGMRHTLFHTKNNGAYAEVKVGDHVEVWPVNSLQYRQLLTGDYYRNFNDVPDEKSLNQAIALLAARAIYDGKQRDVSTRIRNGFGSIFVDLADDDGRSVIIGRNGWKMHQKPYFTRNNGMMELPEPTEGTLRDLRPFVNLDNDQWLLLQMFLVSSLRPQGPFWILALNGRQGSGKSLLSRVIQKLIDPQTVHSQKLFTNERDLAISASNRHLLVYDNLSNITARQSDDLCRVSTGDGLSTRKLYTDTEEILLQSSNPVVINGITNLIERPDLESRSLQLTLPVLNSRKSEEQFWDEFDEAWAGILGGLYEAVSVAFQRRDQIVVNENVRMLDPYKWALAAEPALDCEQGDVQRVYEGRTQRQHVQLLNSDPLASAIVQIVKTKCGTDHNRLVAGSSPAGPTSFTAQCLSACWDGLPFGPLRLL